LAVDSELEALKQVLKKTFENIKEDISTNKADATVNSREIERLHEYNRKLEMQLMQQSETIKAMQIELSKLNESALNQAQQTQQAQQVIIQQVKPVENGLDAQILRKVDRNRKSLVKKKIIAIASSQELTLPELKDIVVDEQNLCSKASFYRYFEDLKVKGHLSTISIDDSEIVVCKKLETSLR